MSLPIPLPVHAPQFRRPETAPVQDVCPHCKRRTVVHSFWTETFCNTSHHCPEHGAVVPVRSSVVNGY